MVRRRRLSRAAGDRTGSSSTDLLCGERSRLNPMDMICELFAKAGAFVSAHRVRLSATLFTGVLLAIGYLSGSPGVWSAFFGPALLGSLTIAMSGVRFWTWIDAQGQTAQRLRAWSQARRTVFRRYIAYPLGGVTCWLWLQTRGISDPCVRAGVRVASALYAWSVFLYVAYCAAMLMIVVVYGAVMLMIVVALLTLTFIVLGEMARGADDSVESMRRTLGSPSRGNSREQRVNPETGVEEQRTFLGWSSIQSEDGRETRINPDSGVREAKSWLGWSPISGDSGREERVNQSTGVEEDRTWPGWAPSLNDKGREQRTNPTSGAAEERTWLGWAPTTNDNGREERINPETGVREEWTLLGWVPKSR